MQYNLLRGFRDRNKCKITAKNIMKPVNCNCIYLHSATYAHYIHIHACTVTKTAYFGYPIQLG